MLISKIGQKQISVRVAFAGVYLLLAAGSVIMIYPFLLMFTSATTTIEYDRYYPLPVFLWDDSALLGKYLSEKYTGPSSDLANLGAKYAAPINSVSDLKTAMLDGDLLKDLYAGMNPDDQQWREAATTRVEDWLEFKKTLPVELLDVYFCGESLASAGKVKAGFLGFLRAKYAREIEQRYRGDVRRFQRETGISIKSFEKLEKEDRVLAHEISRAYHVHLGGLHDVRIPQELLASHTWLPHDTPRMNDWLDYKRTLPQGPIQALCLSRFYQDFLARKYSIGLFNALYNRECGSFRELVFWPQRPVTAGEISDWNDFLRVADDLSTVRLIVNPAARLLYEQMLRETFGTADRYNARFLSQKKAFFEVELASRLPTDPKKAALWERFLRELAPRHLIVPIPDRQYHNQILRSRYVSELQGKYLSVKSLNAKMGTRYRSFDQAYEETKAVQLLIEQLAAEYGSLEEYNRANNAAWKSWADVVLPSPLHRAWQDFLLEKYGEAALVSAAHRRDYASFGEIPLPAILPDHDLVEFVKTALPLRLVALRDNPENRRLWYDHLSKSFGGSVDRLSAAVGKSLVAFEEIPFYYALPRDKTIRPLWIEFVEKVLPYESIHFQDPEANFRLYLREKYGTLERVNAAHGMRYPSLEEIRPPYKEVDLLEFYRGKGAIRMSFLWGNGIGAIRLAVLQGRALLNTAILCILSVAGALIVNPLAAYALSRFRRVLSHRVHFLLLVTAAFPAILTMVPNFLLLRGVGLLNTYWAVVLPTMASGLGILLLKSYFDRIPPELYETARLDGAGEFRTFTHVCLPLSRPILAIVALQTFVFSYGRFLWPLLTCQKEKMWPLMVWLYQLELRHGADSPQLVMAALLVAALPLVTVYILCQRAVLRGINLPSFR